MRRMPSWSQKIEARTFPANFCTRNFSGGVSRYAATPLITALSSGHSDIIKFRPWSQIATGNHLDRAEKFQKLLRRLAPLTFLICVQAFQGTHFAENFRMSKSSWTMNPTRSREVHSCSSIDLAEIRRSSKISSWIWSIISRVVTVLGRPGRGASQVEKSQCFNWATQFLTVTYDGACSPNVSFRMAWISFGALLCRGGILDDSSRLHVVEIARVAWHASFSLCSKKRLAICFTVRTAVSLNLKCGFCIETLQFKIIF